MMKNLRIYLLAGALVLLILLAGCTGAKQQPAYAIPETASFEPGEHPRDDNYAAVFKTYHTENDAFSLDIERGIYAEDVAADLYSVVRADLLEIADTFELLVQPELFVVQVTATGRIVATGNQIFCTASEVESGEYRRALVAAALGLTEPWKIEGAATLVFDTGAGRPDDAKLRAYYSDSQNLDTLSLFGAYFYEKIADQATIDIAKETARSLTKFIIDQHGADAFVASSFSDGYRQEWLHAIGVDEAFALDQNYSYLEGAVFSASARMPMIIQIDNITFNYLENWSEEWLGDEVFLCTPAGICWTLRTFFTDIENLMRYIEAEAPLHYERIQANWHRPLNYTFGATATLAKGKAGVTTIAYYSHLIHETIHMLVFDAYGDNAQWWKDEGIAEYLSNMPYLTIKRENLYALFMERAPSDDADTARFTELVHAYYVSVKGSLPSSFEAHDNGAMDSAVGVVSLGYPKLKPDISSVLWPVAQKRAGSSRAQGVDLNYPEAHLFIEYLVQRFGLDRVLEFCFTANADYEAMFGESYDDLFAGLMNDVVRPFVEKEGRK